jgi:hypothetical protein
MAKKAKSRVVVRMDDPKTLAAPDLSYGSCSLSVDVKNDNAGHPVKLTVTTVVDLPEATRKNRLNQDLLSATRIVGEASKYLKDREDFFKGQILTRMQTKGVKIEPGFLTPELSAQNKKDFEWKQFAEDLMYKIVKMENPKLSPKRARQLAIAECADKYKNAPIKKKNKDGSKVKPKVSVKGVKRDA